MWDVISGAALRAFCIWLVAVALVPGCAPSQAPPLPKAVREQLNPLRMIVPGIPTAVTITPIPSGLAKGAAQGAGQSVADSLQGCLDVDPTGICFVVALYLSPYFAVGGAFYGLATVEPADKVAAAESEIRKAMVQQAFHSHLASRVAAAAKLHAGDVIVIPIAPEGQGGDLARLESEVKLELAVTKIGLGRRPAVNPKLYLTMEARVRVLRSKGGAELYRGVFPYRSSQGHQFAEWASDGAEPLRQALRRGYQAMAEAIVRTVFVLPDAG